jgi:titin
MQAQIEPTNDNQLVVEWLYNGTPLSSGHRFKLVHAFGYVALDILYAYGQDSGTYTCRISNSQGQAESNVDIQVASKVHALAF